MDQIMLATITSAVVNLALEAAKDVAPQAVKDTWEQAKKCMGWEKSPPPEQLAHAVATKLRDDDELGQKLTALLRERPAGGASALVGSVSAEKVVIGGQIDSVTM